jgi:hypothetical protein
VNGAEAANIHFVEQRQERDSRPYVDDGATSASETITFAG